MRTNSLFVLIMISLNEMGFSFRFLLETDFLHRRWRVSAMVFFDFRLNEKPPEHMDIIRLAVTKRFF